MDTLQSGNNNIHFQFDVRKGLTSFPKQLPSKYFYDEKGSELFEKITELDEYYVTNVEKGILEKISKEFLEDLGNKNLEIYDLGPGDCSKTLLLLSGLGKDHFGTYYPVDVSLKFLEEAQVRFSSLKSNFRVSPINSDYFKLGEKIEECDKGSSRLVLFLGANIGNFSKDKTNLFLKSICSRLNKGDFFFIGFDLKKDLEVLKSAYNDKSGITKDFNLNLLSRMNRELGANFSEDDFIHYGPYNPLNHSMESYIISKYDQQVYIRDLDLNVSFRAFEPIFVERSVKYDVHDIKELAFSCGMRVIKNYFDDKRYFCDSLWQVM